MNHNPISAVPRPISPEAFIGEVKPFEQAYYQIEGYRPYPACVDEKPPSEAQLKIRDDIFSSENPLMRWQVYIISYSKVAQLVDETLSYLGKIGAELNAVESQKAENKACKDIRGDREESRDEGNSGHQARSYESNR